MARIVIDNRVSGETTGRYSDKLVEYLHEQKPAHDVIVLTRSHRINFVKKIAPNFTVIESNYPDFSFGEQLGLAKQLYTLKADLVHFAMVQQPVLYMRPKVTSMLDLTTLRFKNQSKNPIVFAFKQFVYVLVNWWATVTSRHIITISNFVRNDVAKTFHVSKEKITTTYNAADKITDDSQPLSELVDKQFIFYTGRPQPHKNLQRLIEAFVKLQKDFPELKLVLAGKKDVLYEQHEKFVKEQGINGVLFTGFVSEGELKWLYEHTAAYIFPSLSEGFGLPGLEAMMHGAPVVSSKATCLPEIYKDAVLYFDPLDTDDMVQKISDVLRDPGLQKSLSSKGEQLAKTYSWKRMAQQTLDVYEKALS